MENVLYDWVTESTHNNKVHGERVNVQIQRYLDSLSASEDTITVYRGHTPDRPKIIPAGWFSTSDNKEIAFEYAPSGCCLFKIHVLPGIKWFKVFDVITDQTLIQKLKEKGWDESEIIVNGKGHFYADRNLKTSGFQEIKPTFINNVKTTTFETWYGLPREPASVKSASATPAQKKFIDADTLFDRISPDQYQYITNKKDFRSFEYLLQNEETTDEIMEEVLKRIREKIEIGGSRKARKTRKARRKTRKSKV